MGAHRSSGGWRDSAGGAGMVDWDLAVKVASRMAGDGPAVGGDAAAAVVAELREDAERSSGLVREFTGLAARARTAPVVVVDRPGWIRANAEGFSRIVAPLVDKLESKRGAPGPLSRGVGARVTGVEVGTLLGFLSPKVLGQFDPFHVVVPPELEAGASGSTGTGAGSAGVVPGGSGSGAGSAGPPASAGRLLLVAPNIVHVEHELGVDPHDFRLWVCLHEETHRIQFTAVPWLREHLHAEIAAVVDAIETDPSRILQEGAKRLTDLVTNRDGAEGASLLDLVQSPEQKVVLDRITGVMSLLEGHADVVMDGVGPEVIPSVEQIRAKFDQRRKGVGVLDRLLRRLLGLDQKMAQYRDGAAFVRSVVGSVGMEGFNRVWSEPAALPSRAEITDPAAWVRRVHG